MIRINLLPQRRRQAAGGAEIWALATIVLLVLELVGCFILYGFKKDDLDLALSENQALQSQIAQVKEASKNHKEVKKKLKRMRAREKAIAKLQSARSGPTEMLLEVAKLLTPGRGPSIDPEKLSKLRRETPQQDFNPKWDSRRLWLTRFVESNRKVQLDGVARDGEDVSELARRMNLSNYFYDVTLLPARRTAAQKGGVAMLAFKLEAKVKY